MTVDIELKASLNTDTFAQSLSKFGEVGDNLINTGIERLGGITNIYEKESTYAQAGERVYTEDGKEISLTDSSVADYQILSLDGVAVGQVSEYGVEKTTVLDACDDSFLDSNSYTTAVLRGNVITLTEFDFDKVQLNTRSITFTNLGNVLQFYTSLSFVQYQNQHYADSQEFALRLGEQVIILKESTPSQAIDINIAFSGVSGTLSVVYNGMLIVAGGLGKVASFDGSLWKYADGTGSGSGIYNNGTVTGNSSISGCCVYKNSLVVCGAGGRIGSYDGTTWINYNNGAGICNTGGVVNSELIHAMCAYGTYLVVGSAVSGNVGSWDGTGWTNYNAGSGLCNAGTALGGNPIATMCQYTTSLVIAGFNGRVASWTGSAWVNYNAGAGLCSNGTVVGTNTILSSYVFGASLVLGAEFGRIGSWNGSAWTNYNAGSGLCNNATVIGGVQVYCFATFGIYLVVGGNNGRVGSWNGTTWTNYNAGSGLRSNATVVSTEPIYSMAVYDNILVINGALTLNTLSVSGVPGIVYTQGSTIYAYLLKGITTLNYTYVYRYENGLYLINQIDNNLQRAVILNNSTFAINTVLCGYAFPQVSGGYTRHITTQRDVYDHPIYDSLGIRAAGLVGYTDFTTFSGNVIFPANNIIIGNNLVIHSKAAFNYSDFTYQTTASATDIFNYVSQFKPTTNGLYQILQGNTDTLIDGYGKLTNGIDLPSTKPFEIRVCMIAGQASFLSAAILDGIQSDTLGVMITNIGEFDASYQPQIKSDSIIMYLSNGSIVIKKIGIAAINKVQQIAPTVYKINTISPLNILDTNTGLLHVGSSDYNNRMLFTSTVAPGLVSKVVSLFEGEYSNSVDTGDKLVTINPLTSAKIQIVGSRIPIVSTSTGDYAIDTYIEDNYSFSTLNDGSELVKPSKENLVYAETPIIPVAIGQTYSSGITTGNNNTIFLKPDYDGYSIGNDISGVFTLFKLYGQTYLFDGVYIYTADIGSTGIFSAKTNIAPAGGLRYIASSPTEITFLSTFDNSVYTFTGGRNLSKAKRFTSVENINSGVFDVRENTLVLDTNSTIIFIRDSLATLNNKKVNQTGVKYYPTAKGVIISNNINSWQYTYDALPGSTVVPLDLKTGYYGFENTNNSILQSFIVTIYNENRTKVTIDAVNYTIQADDDIEQSTRWVVNPNDYNAGGFARLRIIPQQMKTLGSGLRLTTNDKIMLVSLQAEIENGEKATVAKNRTV